MANCEPKEKGFPVQPVVTSMTTRHIEKGWGGNKPLPVADMPGPMVVTQWIPPEAAIQAMVESPHVISFAMHQDGSVSMRIMPVELMKGQ